MEYSTQPNSPEQSELDRVIAGVPEIYHPNPEIQGILTSLQGMKRALQDGTAFNTDTPADVSVDTPLLKKDLTQIATILGDGILSYAPGIVTDDATRTSVWSRAVRAGIRAVLEAGYCIVTEESVRRARLNEMELAHLRDRYPPA